MEQTVFAMKNRFLQSALDEIGVQWRARHSQEQSQFCPVPKQVRDGFAQPGVRLRLMFRELRKPGKRRAPARHYGGDDVAWMLIAESDQVRT